MSLACLALRTLAAMEQVVWMGWKLGVMESTNIAILIGISVDFVVHFAHAYRFPKVVDMLEAAGANESAVNCEGLTCKQGIDETGGKGAYLL